MKYPEIAQTRTAAALAFFAAQGDSYRTPVGTVAVLAWADAVPSPVQASLAEPALHPAAWSPGEAGVVVTGGSGELLLAATDHAVAGRALGFSFDRSYRSGVIQASLRSYARASLAMAPSALPAGARHSSPTCGVSPPPVRLRTTTAAARSGVSSRTSRLRPRVTSWTTTVATPCPRSSSCAS